MSRRVKLQKTRVVQSRKDASHGEHSPYWADAEAHSRTRDGGDDALQEHPQANPDVLPETEIATPSTPQLIMGEAIAHLQGRQKEVYLLLMREGKTYAETAQILGVARGVVQTYEKRAIKFITQYCKNAMDKGRA